MEQILCSQCTLLAQRKDSSVISLWPPEQRGRGSLDRSAKHALINGQVFIFGGNNDSRKVTLCMKINQYQKKTFQISKLNECSLVDVSARLNVAREGHHEAMSMDSGSQGKIILWKKNNDFSSDLFWQKHQGMRSLRWIWGDENFLDLCDAWTRRTWHVQIATNYRGMLRERCRGMFT